MDQNTTVFNPVKEEKQNIREIMLEVADALKEKGYEPSSQIIGYILSGDPTYITSHKNARALICQIDRDDLLEDMIKKYLQKN